MRTNITIGEKHEGGFEIISAPTVPVHEQEAAARKRLHLPIDDKFKRIILVDTTEPLITGKFFTKEHHEAIQKVKAENAAETKVSMQAQEKRTRETGEGINARNSGLKAYAAVLGEDGKPKKDEQGRTIVKEIPRVFLKPAVAKPSETPIKAGDAAAPAPKSETAKKETVEAEKKTAAKK